MYDPAPPYDRLARAMTCIAFETSMPGYYTLAILKHFAAGVWRNHVINFFRKFEFFLQKMHFFIDFQQECF